MAEFNKTNLTSTATGSATGTTFEWPGGVGQVTVTGTYSSATAKVQYRPDTDFAFVNVGTNVSFTANGMGNFELPQGSMRAIATGIAGTAPNLNIYVGINKVRDVKKEND